MISSTEDYTRKFGSMGSLKGLPHFFLEKSNILPLFLFYCIFYVVINIYASNYIFFEEVYYRSFSDQLTGESIESFLNIQSQYAWVNYIFVPLIFFFRVLFVVICIGIGIAFSDLEFKFKTIFRAILLAEVVFLVAQIIYMINLSLHLNTLTLEKAANYYPLTTLSYFGTENVVPWLRYPLQTINVFEVLYMAVIAWLLSKQWKEDFMESMALVVPSYGTGLILWLVFVTFITLQIS